MTQAVSVQIADGVKDVIDGGSFSQTFTLRRLMIPVLDTKSMRGIYVTVTPRTREGEWQTRSLVNEDYEIDIAVQRVLSDADREEQVEALVYLVQEIDDYLRTNKVVGDVSAQWIQSSTVEMFAPEHIIKDLFTGFITVTYKVIR